MADRYRDRLFSADDSYARESRSAPQQPSPPDDPLAELARLIGQADPFSTYGREQHSASQSAHQHDPHQAEEPAGYEEEPARPSWLQNLASSRQAREQSYDQRGYEQQAYGHQEPSFSPQPQSYGQDEQYDHQYADARGHDPYQQGHDHHAAEPQFEMTPHFDSAPRYERKNLSVPQAPQEPEWGHAPLPDSARYDNVLYGQPDHDAGHGTPFNVQDDYGDGYGDQSYSEEEEQPRARRGGTMTVVVVLLLAVVGTAGAFAYRTLAGSPRSGEPPVIKADAGPNKIIPPSQGTDNANKQIYDRVGDKNTERVVPREEQPIDVNARTSPRVVFPPLTQNNNPPTVASASPTVRPTGPGLGNGTLSGEEPRKIRTLSIRPGEQDAQASVPAPAPQARAAAQPAPQRVAAPATTASTPAPNAPVSLAPQAQSPQAAPDTRRMASLSQSAGAAGAYVQVSSQKSEADAQASFRTLQAKYSGILGSRTSTVRRADLGSKGVFYRAMVGPFGTTEEAAQFCSSLKSAGGQCVVQRN
ncbi:SPOR domain-containing protein [Bradyrhizobium sp. SYSU BS000235]|uniref:SPOR domain-containing protein n=1 Tax=Bradyrhizobium sp. SYSU BS000235 TaxID=3411332 RepID=UPI003C70D49A